MAGRVMTVDGPVDAAELGVVLPHEHLFCNTLREYRSDGLLDDRALMEREVAAFHAAGGGTIVELTGSTLGRRPEDLRAVSRATGVHVVMGCGLYRDPYLADTGIDRLSVAALAAAMVAEIVDGVGDTGIRPGVIGEVGTDAAWVSAREERSLRAAARAQVATGLTLSLHAARWPVGRLILPILEQEGVAATRVIVGHLDTVRDSPYHVELARQGCYVEFDGFSTTHEYDLERMVRDIVAVADAGFLDRLLISHDLFRQSHLTAYGGVGFAFILEHVTGRLRAAGFGEDELRRVLVDNPRAALTGEAVGA